MSVINMAGPCSGTAEALNASGSISVVADPFTPAVGEWAWRSNPTTTGTGAYEFGTISGVDTQAAENVGATRYFGFWFGYATKPASNEEVIFRSNHTSGGSKFTLRLTSGGVIKAYNAGAAALLATGTTVLSANTWYKFKLEVGHGSSAAYKLYINDVLEFSGTGANLSTSNYDKCYLGKQINTNNQGVDLYYAGLVIDNASLPPDGYKIAQGVPTGAGTYTGFTGTYTDVDERPNDGDTTHIYYPSGTLTNAVETVTLTWNQTLSGTVSAVKHMMMIGEGESGNCVYQFRCRSGGSNSDTADISLSSAAAYAQRYRLMLTNPVTTSAWTVSEVNAVELGLEKVTNTVGRVKCSQIIGSCLYVPQTGYTLTIEAGSYTLTGTAVTLAYGRKTAIASGSYTITGTAVGLKRGYPILVGAGSYSLTGSDLLFHKGFTLTAGAGSFTITGTSVPLLYGHVTPVDAGSYTITGSNVGLAKTYPLNVGSGSYTISGTDVILTHDSTLLIGAGSYTLTGTAVILKRGYPLTIGTGSYTITGQDILFKHAHKSAIGSGSYIITGSDVTLLGGKFIQVDSGDYDITGTDVDFQITRGLPINSGSYSLTGGDVLLVRGRTIIIAGGSFSITGTDVNLKYGHKVAIASGSYTINGSEVNLVFGAAQASLPIESGSYTLTGTGINLLFNHKLIVQTGTYVLTGLLVNLQFGHKLPIGPGTYTLVGSNLSMTLAHRFVIGSGSYNITGTDVEFLLDRVLITNTGTYTISGSSVILTYTPLSNFKPYWWTGNTLFD